MVILKLILGLGLLVAGAEALVRGASKIAARQGVSSLVIGLTIVAFGTSAPELAVSSIASVQGEADIALGNVVGSNIFNVLCILGISALLAPLLVAQQLIRLDVPIMIGASLLTLLTAWDGIIRPWEGAVMLALGIFYTWYIIRLSKQEKSPAVLAEYREAFGNRERRGRWASWQPVALVLVGLVLLVWGSRWLVEGAVAVATLFGVSSLVIGLTIVAAGTSLPELATSVVASLRGEQDIAVGNIVGSNIFNILYILGISAIIGRDGIAVAHSALVFDLPVMIAVAVACLPIFFTGRKLDRWEGAVFLVYYVAYTVYLVLASQMPASMGFFIKAMIWFVVPLTALTLVVVAWQAARKDR